MRQSLADYRREVEEKAEAFAQQEQTVNQVEHLRAFNLGRIVQRVQYSRHQNWLRLGWLMAGLAIGVALGRIPPDRLYPTPVQRFITKATSWVHAAENAALSAYWKRPSSEQPLRPARAH